MTHVLVTKISIGNDDCNLIVIEKKEIIVNDEIIIAYVILNI
jgi:hypothetical protein